MFGRNRIVSGVSDTPYLIDPGLYETLPVYTDLVDDAVVAELEWLNARSAGEVGALKGLLEAYTTSLAPRRCRLSGTLLACSGSPGGKRAGAAELYVRIRLASASATYRDRLYESVYVASPSIEGADATIRDLSEAKIGEEVHLVGWLDRSFCVPGFYLARPRVYRGLQQTA